MTFQFSLDRIDRREFFGYLSAATTAFLAASLTSDGEGIAPRSAITGSSSRLDEATVQHLEEATRLVRRSMVELRLPTRIQVGDAVAQMRRVLSLDLRGQPNGVQRRLVALVGENAAVAGWLSAIGLWDFTAGNAYLDIAQATARESGHGELEALVLGYKSYLSAWNGHPGHGLQLAESGLKTARGTTATTRARLATAAAEMYALNGQQPHCWRRFDDAHNAMAELGETIPSWIGFGAFDHLTLTSKQGNVLLEQGRAHDAITLLTGALGGVDISHSFYIDALTSLAAAYLIDGEIVEGSEHAKRALRIATEVEAGELVNKVRSIYQSSRSRYGDHSAIVELGEYLRASLSAPL
jgi:hypothetical protein